MMFKRVTVIILLGLLIGPAAQSQNIIRRIRGLVLIDTDSGIGKAKSKIPVYRDTGQGRIEVGTVKIVQFRKGMAAAAILKEAGSYKIRKGDFVVRQSRSGLEDRVAPSARSVRLAIARMSKQFLLLDGDAGNESVNLRFPVYRKSTIGEIHVGEVTIVKVAGGKTAARIEAQTKPYHMRIGDYVSVDIGDPEGDIDYYFFEEFAEK